MSTFIFKHVSTSNLAIIVAKDISEAKLMLADKYANYSNKFKLHTCVNEHFPILHISFSELENDKISYKKEQEAINNIKAKM